MPADLSAAPSTLVSSGQGVADTSRLAFPTEVLKAAIDKLGALAALVVFAPIMAAIALILAATQSGPIFFAHSRVGKDGRSFGCLKFRTMVPEAKEILDEILASDPIAREEWNENFKLDNDPRVTRFGNFLRKTSLDELPQIFNVLRGDMSLVGPRPITKEEGILYGRHFAAYKSVRPGVTGLWQVMGRSTTSYDDRVALDVDYIRNLTAWRDLKILFATVFVVLSRRGAQ